jgi:hypothetical protein
LSHITAACDHGSVPVRPGLGGLTKETSVRKFRVLVASALVAMAAVAGVAIGSAVDSDHAPTTSALAEVWTYRP